MAATLSLDTITSSGSTITVPTGKTLAVTDSGALTIGGSAITAGSSNILRKQVLLLLIGLSPYQRLLLLAWQIVS
jgi:hypothetical protein